MDQVLKGCEDGGYIDDMVIYSKVWERVLSRLLKAGLTVKVIKCQFECTYLGHIIGGGKIRPDTHKLQAVAELPRLQTKKDSRAFLGLVGYYQRFIPYFSHTAMPLSDLTKKKLPDMVEWSGQCEKALRKY